MYKVSPALSKLRNLISSFFSSLCPVVVFVMHFFDSFNRFLSNERKNLVADVFLKKITNDKMVNVCPNGPESGERPTVLAS